MSVLHRLGPTSLIVTAAIAVVMFAAAGPAGAGGIDDVLVDTPGSVQPQGKNIVVKLEAGADEVVSIAASGHVNQGGHRFGLRRATATVAPGRRATLELRPRKAWQERKIRQALNKGRTLEARVRIRFRDVVGNVAHRARTITLT
jgi:hypothetical protein